MTRARNRRRRVPLHPATSGSFHPINVDSNGADCKTNGSVDTGDHTDYRHSQQAPGAGTHRLEDPWIGKKDAAGRRSQGHSPSCPHHPHQQKWEGRDGSDLRKNVVCKHQGAAEDGKHLSKPREYTPYMAARAKELKEEGNRMFQRKEYSNAMDQYELALKLTPPDHPDRAIFHSNRAACLMQMKPLQYDAAIHECNLALCAQPGFPRALLRRARALEATGKYELALQDAELLLQGDVSHPDAVEMARRIRECMSNEGKEAHQQEDNEAWQVNQGTPPATELPADVKTHVEVPINPRIGAPSVSIPQNNSESEVHGYSEDDHGAVLTPYPLSQRMEPPSPPYDSSQQQTRFQPVFHAPPCEASLLTSLCEPSSDTVPCDSVDTSKLPSSDPCKSESLKKVIHQDSIQTLQRDDDQGLNMRPLKLIYDHDIRLAEMPVDCKFSDLRKLVKDRFPSSKSILIKYKDAEGDLVTITSTHDLRLAEAAAAIDAASRSFRMASMDGFSQGPSKGSAIGLPVVPSMLDQLRLHVVEVPADQEPYDKEEIATIKAEDSTVPREDLGKAESPDSRLASEKGMNAKGKEDFDKWLLDFAQLFRAHLGIDPNGHIDLHERGMELCGEALEEAASTEEAHKLFELAASKFQEMTALGFLNWGNVFMCAARKQLPHGECEDGQLDFCDRLQAAFDWAQAQYALAEEKFNESIHVKSDFCDAMLCLGQKDFESAKLHWSLAIAKQIDLNSWDSSEMLELFHKAEGTMQRAAELLQKQECLSKDVELSAGITVEMEDARELEVGSDVNGKQLTSEQDVALKSQVYLFWGNILYEHSQVVFRLGLPSWKELLNAAVEKFEVAGASPLDISTALDKHLSNSSVFLDTVENTIEEDSLNHEKDKLVDGEENDYNVAGCDLAADGISEEKGIVRNKEAVEQRLPSSDDEDVARDEHTADERLPDSEDKAEARDDGTVDQRLPQNVMV